MAPFSPFQEDAFTPAQTMQVIARTGAKKATMRQDKLIVNSILAGVYLSFGCAAYLVSSASPWYRENAQGLIEVVSAMFFPVGLILIGTLGAEMWTSTAMFSLVAWLEGHITFLQVVQAWFISFFGNMVGAFFLCFVICAYGGVFDDPVYAERAVSLATSKALEPAWHQIFLKAIGANWLVCLAVFLGLLGRELISKIFGIWWPIVTFVALGLDHVIANFFLIPLGMWHGAPFGVGFYIWHSMIPAFLGNTIGGGFFVGGVYWYLFMTGEERIDSDFDAPEKFLRNATPTEGTGAGSGRATGSGDDVRVTGLKEHSGDGTLQGNGGRGRSARREKEEV